MHKICHPHTRCGCGRLIQLLLERVDCALQRSDLGALHTGLRIESLHRYFHARK